MLATTKANENDFPLYLFHEGKTPKQESFSEHMPLNEEGAVITGFEFGHRLQKAFLSLGNLTSGIARKIRWKKFQIQYGKLSFQN